MNWTNKWMNNSTFLAQSAHFFGAYSTVMSSYVFGGKVAAIIVSGSFIAAAAIKEFFYDAKYEIPTQTTFDNVLDFSSYMVGLGVALAVVLTR